MGFITKSSRAFNYGEEFENCYGKIENISYDYKDDFWSCQVDFYASPTAREYAKMIQICQKLSWDFTRPKETGSKIPPFFWKDKDSKFNDLQWKKIQLYSIRPLPRLLFQYTFGVRAPLIGEVGRDKIMGVLYENLISQCEPDSIAMTNDRTEEEILGEYLAKDLPELKNPDPTFFSN